MNELNDIIEEVLSKEKRNKFTFLTGAGISADSGIPTYRGSDGIWVKGTKYHKPEEFGTYKYFIEHQEEVWQYTLFRKKMIENAKPNESHKILADLENILGDRFHLITQNIDNLHRRAGNQNIYEVHGNYREVKCSMDCKDILSIPSNLKGKDIKEELRKDEIDSLKCSECGNWLRPNILWFDEYYDEKTNKKFSALKVAKNSGILFIVGTSGATNLPLEIARTTLKYGGYVVDMNIEDNHFTNLLKGKKRALVVRKRSNDILPVIKEQIEKSIEQGI
ncbi:SIR2 family NAD-dependent protein deacylase [Aquimarina macrocephali]|uniref:SIR2 family NAD-dependent protein deacylase n=1 Tax=Aquimarina macrocephali TaxID=666563 RepID=UPI0004652898|nr:Sir2 family NAD-dependent protein deacetylase [Aquimarina macrocephali]